MNFNQTLHSILIGLVLGFALFLTVKNAEYVIQMVAAILILRWLFSTFPTNDKSEIKANKEAPNE